MPKILSTLFLAAAMMVGAPAAGALAQDGSASAAEDRPRAGRRGHRGHRGRFGRRGHRMRRMAAQLNLTEAQREQIRSLRQSARSGSEGRLDPSARRALHQQMMQVLTPAQQTQMAELRGQHQSRRIDRRVTRMTERLSLSQQQSGQVRGILTQAAQQRSALREQARLDETSPREAMGAVRERTHALIRSVLNAEQQAELDSVIQNRRGRRGHRGHRGWGRGGGQPGGGHPAGGPVD